MHCGNCGTLLQNKIGDAGTPSWSGYCFYCYRDIRKGGSQSTQTYNYVKMCNFCHTRPATRNTRCDYHDNRRLFPGK